MDLKILFRALKNRNYRLFFIAGACASRFGAAPLLASGVICLAGGIWFSFNRKELVQPVQ